MPSVASEAVSSPAEALRGLNPTAPTGEDAEGLRTPLRVISGGGWTTDGRWVVIGNVYGRPGIIFDPDHGIHFWDLLDCIAFVNKHEGEA